MPCYQVVTCSCTLEHADTDLLKKALEKQGYTVYVSTGTKVLTFSKGGTSGSYRNNNLEFQYSKSSVKPDTDAIKRAYSEQVILAKAADYCENDGWEFEQDGNEYILRKNTSGYGAVYA